MEIFNGDATKELLGAQAQICKYTFNYIISLSFKCAVQLGIPDAISNHGKAITLIELGNALSIPKTKSTQLYRLMRILVHSGFFGVQQLVKDQEGYVLTASSKLLLKNHETNLSQYVLLILDPIFLASCLSMSAWFQGSGSSSSPFEVAHGMNVWNYFGQHFDCNKSFNAAMASDSEFLMNVVVKEYKAMFQGFDSLVDVGGGTGSAVKAISKAYPLMKCTVLDLPGVVHNIESSNNIKFVGGDMFESVPSADIILLKWILHDWGDEECVKILQRCREAIRSAEVKEGKVVIIDIVIDMTKGKHESTESQLCYDILMMAAANGKERTETEWERLFLGAGFRSYKISHGLGLRSIIEVFPQLIMSTNMPPPPPNGSF